MIGEMIMEARKAGRTPLAAYYIGSALRQLRPRRWLNERREKLLAGVDSRPDAEYIHDRAGFYCRLAPGWREMPADEDFPVVALGDLKMARNPRLYFDLQRVLRWFPADCTAAVQSGRLLRNPSRPALVKSRLIGEGAENGVLLPLDRVRLWSNPHDMRPFAAKCPKLVFRGKTEERPERRRFLEMWHGHELMDLGATDRHPARPEWRGGSISTGQHFDFRFVLCLEGADVAADLQWVMASGCVPVIPRPTRESWLMQSRMEPGVHYAEIRSDFSDAGRVVEWLAAHPREAQAIAEASTRWAQQFADPRRELLIQLLVGRRYLLGE